MSMLSSCTPLSLAPPAPAPGKFSPATLQLRTKQPAASSAAVALPRAAPRHKVSRALRLVCQAQPYDIPPTALVHPKVGHYGDWKINEDKDRITLAFMVGDKTKVDNLEVTATRDQVLNLWLLVIRYNSNGSDGSLATSLDANLVMPPGYDDKNVMTAEILPDGWLDIIIAKPKQEPKNIKVTKRPGTNQAVGTA
ncbi:unnamed protein product [Urochloa decumbens]|uniref:SHSP domain-containing protein n=1 Tax=Urochloa decumbens TaxID=240449 RepID=A0ABC8VWZ7_9POAL